MYRVLTSLSTRPDIVSMIHNNVAKNKRQPYCVSEPAGHQVTKWNYLLSNIRDDNLYIGPSESLLIDS